jgi:hypothetical protein
MLTDFLYLTGTAALFVAMFGYVRACERLGRRADPER